MNAADYNSNPLYKKWSLRELMTTDFPEPRYLIPGILTEGLTILGGSAKLGKSWLALDMAVSISSGEPCLTNKVYNIPARVLYLALEDTPRRLKSRLEKQKARINDRLDIFTAWAPPGQEFIRLHEYMEENPDTSLIIIDTLVKFMDLGDSDRYVNMTQKLSSLKSFADEYKISIVVIHHTSKNSQSTDYANAILGSVAIIGVVDSILVLSRARNQIDGKLSVTGRDIEEQEFALSFNKDFCKWQVMGNAIDFAESRERQEILDILHSSWEPLGASAIAEIINKKPGTVRFLLMKLRDSGHIIPAGKGKYVIKDYTDRESDLLDH